MSDKNIDIPTWPEILRTADRDKERKIDRALVCFVAAVALISAGISWHVSAGQKTETPSSITRAR